jgi:hypothetical protein
MWQLTSAPSASLPRLAWCAILARDQSKLVVHHGPWVEVSDSGFVEGAWSGPYRGLAFTDAVTFTGSGGLVTRDGLLCATPTHSLEPLYILRAGRQLHCSNSLPFLLASAHDDIDPTYRFYDVNLTSMAFGLNRYCPRVPTQNRNWVHIYQYCNVLLGDDLSVSVQPKTQPRPFSCFHDYRAFLQDQILQTLSNAADTQRTVSYRPLLTLSTGYDSLAASVLAMAAGCREAITFTTSRNLLGAAVDDSGKSIGALLGLDVTEYDPTGYRAREDLPEAEFVATGGGGGSVALTAAEDRLPGTILLTGHYGFEAWERVNNQGGPGMETFDSAGADLIYFRTGTGFLHLPIGSIGYSRYESIRRITESPEMRPWSLGRREYDRPIPRRIVEEAGIPRQLFGQKKLAVARSLKYCDPYSVLDPNLASVMAPASYRHFQRWAQERPLFRHNFERSVFWAMHSTYHLNLRFIRSKKARLVAHRIGVRLPDAPWVPTRFRKRRTQHRLLFHWGMDDVKARYVKCVE